MRESNQRWKMKGDVKEESANGEAVDEWLETKGRKGKVAAAMILGKTRNSRVELTSKKIKQITVAI